MLERKPRTAAEARTAAVYKCRKLIASLIYFEITVEDEKQSLKIKAID